MRALSLRSSACAVVFVASCGRCGETSRSAVEGGSDASEASDAGADAEAGAHAPLRNLLYTTSAVVAVSSKVDNPKDFPEHLIDGKPETAWNGRTGDLVGGWLAFRVPLSAHVESITMSAGFDKKTPAGDDLFTMNHRIEKVRISRNGAPLREATFDVDRRAPQTVRLDAPGGDFRIEVLEVVPGTKKEWRELTVSELAVWGDPATASLSTTHLPRVLVGSLDAPAAADAGRAPAAKPVDGSYPTLDAFCTYHERVIAPQLLAGKDEYPGFIEGPYCTPSNVSLLATAPPLLDVRSVRVTEWDERSERVAIKTTRGVFVTNAKLVVEPLRDPHCAGACAQEMKGIEVVPTPRGPALVLTMYEHCWSNPFPSSNPEQDIPGSSTYTQTADVCVVDASGGVACTKHDISTTLTKYRAYEDDFSTVRWVAPKARKTTAAGDIVFE